MQDNPPLAQDGRRERRRTSPEPVPTRETGISLWIAAAMVIISMGVMLFLTQGQLKNGGAPFVITPAQLSTYPAGQPQG